ncbi:MAG: NADH:ubiquinone reductase (Na(+)-transporting) subunit E [Lentisphaeria bacterium]
MDLVELAFQSIFSENVVLSLFLGLCPFIAQSRKMSTSFWLGVSVMLVMSITGPINWFLTHYLLQADALYAGLNLYFLRFLIFIAVIAAVVQITEKVILRLSASLHSQLGIFLPLLTVNCAIFGISLFAVERGYSLLETVIFSSFSGFGWLLACVVLSAIRMKIDEDSLPEGLSGNGIVFIISGLMAMAFMAFSGVRI